MVNTRYLTTTMKHVLLTECVLRDMYGNEYLAFKGKQIIAHGSNRESVIELARQNIEDKTKVVVGTIDEILEPPNFGINNHSEVKLR